VLALAFVLALALAFADASVEGAIVTGAIGAIGAAGGAGGAAKTEAAGAESASALATALALACAGRLTDSEMGGSEYTGAALSTTGSEKTLTVVGWSGVETARTEFLSSQSSSLLLAEEAAEEDDPDEDAEAEAEADPDPDAEAEADADPSAAFAAAEDVLCALQSDVFPQSLVLVTMLGAGVAVTWTCG
jgi:hypothetical protein